MTTISNGGSLNSQKAAMAGAGFPKVLLDMVDGGVVCSPDNRTLPLHSHVDPGNLLTLFKMVLASRPKVAVEVGMAYGISSLVMAQAVCNTGQGGRLISIDPNQSTDWCGIGRLNLEKAGLAGFSRIIERPDHLALPLLVDEGVIADFCFIDGWHTFDHTLLDFFYCDLLLHTGGVVSLDDCHLPAVARVCRFILTNRHYEEITPPQPPNYSAGSNIKSLVRYLLRRPRPIAVRYFRKVDNFKPSWNEFPKF